MTPDFRQLEAFLAVAREGGFSRGAERLGLTQPTVSSHVANLEESLGVRLFDRAGKSVALTPAGALLEGYARRLVDLASEAGDALKSFLGELSGEVRVAASTVPGEVLLPRWLGAFRPRFPGIQVILLVGDSQEVMDRMLSGDCALGVAGTASIHPSLSSRSLLTEDIILAAAPTVMKESGLPSRMRAKDLASLPLIQREMGSGTRRMVEKTLADKGMSPESLSWTATLGSTHAVITAARAGLGAAFLSRKAIREELARGDLVELPIGGLSIRREFFLVTRASRTLSPAAAKVAEMLLKEKDQL